MRGCLDGISHEGRSPRTTSCAPVGCVAIRASGFMNAQYKSGNLTSIRKTRFINHTHPEPPNDLTIRIMGNLGYDWMAEANRWRLQKPKPPAPDPLLEAYFRDKLF